MNFSENLRLAWSCVKSNKMRSILTMLGIIIGISAVITISTIGSSLRDTIQKTFSDLTGTNQLAVYWYSMDYGIDIDGLFIAIGQVPNSQCFSNLIDVDNNGYIISSDGVHTNIDGIYVAGDVRVKDLRQLTTAISDGAISATVAIKEMEDIYGK